MRLYNANDGWLRHWQAHSERGQQLIAGIAVEDILLARLQRHQERRLQVARHNGMLAQFTAPKQTRETKEAATGAKAKTRIAGNGLHFRYVTIGNGNDKASSSNVMSRGQRKTK